jgi:branched-subunit amino acid aminotransferase/4-amino-4-deoxychorismate lyase
MSYPPVNSSTLTGIFRVVLIALLSFVAFQLYRIESKMPITRATLMAEKSAEARAKLALSMPVVTVTGEVSIDGAVELKEPVSVVISR